MIPVRRWLYLVTRCGIAASMATEHILGQKILLDRKPYEIIGVMPRGFEFPLVPGQLEPHRALGPHEPDARRAAGAAEGGASTWWDD